MWGEKSFNFIVVMFYNIYMCIYTLYTHEVDTTYAFFYFGFIYSFFHVYWDRIDINSDRIDKNQNRKKSICHINFIELGDQ